jgi:molybdenum cofactor cytidylyltransferase
MSTIVGILLAAGSSQRFGANKLTHILPDGGTCLPQPVSRHSAVLAVVRPGCEILAAQLQAEGAEVRICTNADQGMSASLIFGILTCPEATGWLIALADMPWIAPITIHKIADALRFGAPLAVPSWQGRLGHPVGFSQALRSGSARTERRCRC